MGENNNNGIVFRFFRETVLLLLLLLCLMGKSKATIIIGMSLDMSYKDWVWFGLFKWFWFWGWRLGLKMKKIFSMFIISFNFIFLFLKFLILINFHVCTQLSIFYIEKYPHQLWLSQNQGDHDFAKEVKLKGGKSAIFKLVRPKSQVCETWGAKSAF